MDVAATRLMKAFYRKKPIVIEAIPWEGKRETATEIIDWVLDGGGSASLMCGESCCEGNLKINIHTLEGMMVAEAGDVVIKGIAGEFYPCKGDIFIKSYERAVN